MTGIWYLILGLLLGSFMNVLIYRTPRELNIAYPPSACPHCGAKIKWYSNIPVLSYIFQKGKCKDCKGHISIQYPIVELLTGILFLIIYLKFGHSLITVKYCFLAYILMAAGLTDLMTALDPEFESGIIPDGFTIGGVAFGVIWSFFTYPGFTGALAGAGAGMFILLLPAYLFYSITKREGLGMGDAKLMAMIGAFLGVESILFVLTLSAVLGVIAGMVAIGVTKNKNMIFPYGPMISFAAILYIFFGETVNKFLGIGGI